jgi:hypothetical protein
MGQIGLLSRGSGALSRGRAQSTFAGLSVFAQSSLVNSYRVSKFDLLEDDATIRSRVEACALAPSGRA